ncbi:unnamed protein product [Ceratitis capitata]|uniref:(Mediterranean fruit fly) hypothetical protein n=1 Tax=Ceratitis capitata TaxID=7213 RepID=A0A811UZ92_CERCA|nr:unnamed protein product [Ceratitis capitata]
MCLAGDDDDVQTKCSELMTNSRTDSEGASTTGDEGRQVLMQIRVASEEVWLKGTIGYCNGRGYLSSSSSSSSYHRYRRPSGFHNAECNEGDQTSTTTFEQAAQRLYGSAVGQKLGIAKDTLSGRDFQTRNVTRNTNDVRNFSRPTNQL